VSGLRIAPLAAAVTILTMAPATGAERRVPAGLLGATWGTTAVTYGPVTIVHRNEPGTARVYSYAW
jgi:hypothetical protein